MADITRTAAEWQQTVQADPQKLARARALNSWTDDRQLTEADFKSAMDDKSYVQAGQGVWSLRPDENQPAEAAKPPPGAPAPVAATAPTAPTPAKG